jgi:phage gpG-like protein
VLDAQAAVIAAGVREALSQPPGTEPHEYPWLRTGELRDSVGHDADDAGAVIGSTSDVALYQEHGTPAIPPRPFFAPVAAAHAEAAAKAVGEAVASALRSA